MGDLLNNFFLNFTTTSSLVNYFSVFIIYSILFYVAYRIGKDTAGDGCFFLLVFQVSFNITYCYAILPKDYLLITKIIIGLLPYLVIAGVVFYIDFRKVGKKDD